VPTLATLVTVIALALPAAASAQRSAAPLIPREALFGNPARIQGRISPDGRWISWLAPHAGVMNVWVAPASDPAAARVITADTLRGIARHRWSYDGRHVLFLQDRGGNENFHVYAVPAGGGPVRDLTPVADTVRAVIEGLSPERPGVVLVGINDRHPQLMDLYEVDIASGARTRVATNPGFGDWVVDRRLKPRLGYAERPGGGGTWYRVSDDGTRGDAFLEIPADDAITTIVLGLSAAGDTLYATDSRGRDKAALVAISLATGESRVLAQSDESDIFEVLGDQRSGRPVAYAVEYLTVEWHPLDSAVSADLALLDERLAGTLHFAGATADDRTWMVVHEAPESPVAYALYDRDTRTITPLFESFPRLAGAPLQPMHPVVIPARDGLPLVSYLTLPPGSDADGNERPESPRPAVLWVHGGPWERDRHVFDPIPQWLANRGYAVLRVNFRGSSGFGKAHLNAGIGEWSGKMHDDLIDAVDWAVSEGITHEDSVAIAGASYGGYATLVGVTFTPDRFACGVDIVGPSNLVTVLESFPAYWRPLLEGTFYRHIGDPADPADRERMMLQSPITRVDSIRVPLLIAQGANDPRVVKAESDQIVAAMQAKRLPVTYVVYANEGHGLQRPANRLSFSAAMEGFLAGCLGGRAEPIGDAFEGTSAEIVAGGELIPGLPGR
jgi:dipeptidyl aminopeptidase/acylaminoacyl peptidase